MDPEKDFLIIKAEPVDEALMTFRTPNEFIEWRFTNATRDWFEAVRVDMPYAAKEELWTKYVIARNAWLMI